MSSRASQRLVQLFERELRDFSAEDGKSASAAKKSKRVSGELDEQVVEFAAEVRTSGSTPEQMLVELKTLLARVAPEVPSSQRNALVSTVTGRAIDAFFSPTGDGKKSNNNK
jgi:hypothetical protein